MTSDEISPTHSGVLNDFIWSHVCSGVIAAHNGNGREMVDRLSEITDTLDPRDGRATLYIDFLLHYKTASVCRRMPTRADLQRVAERVVPRYKLLFRSDPSTVENTLLTIFDLASPEQEIGGGVLMVHGAAILGLILTDPVAELATMKPRLEDYWRENADVLRASYP